MFTDIKFMRVWGEAYTHEEMKKQDSLYCCMCRILVVFTEMIDVD